MSVYGQNNNRFGKRFVYEPTTKNIDINDSNLSTKYIKLFNSNFELSHPKYLAYTDMLKNGCCYIPRFFTDADLIFNNLKTDFNLDEKIKWSKHFKIDNCNNSEIFNNVVERLAHHFNIEVTQTRLNYYSSGKDWKPFHHDSHKTIETNTNSIIYENYTIGASFGGSRDITFIHKDDSNMKFTFPQNNGDVFAFDYDTNINFKHGIPKSSTQKDRFSIIVWGSLKK